MSLSLCRVQLNLLISMTRQFQTFMFNKTSTYASTKLLYKFKGSYPPLN